MSDQNVPVYPPEKLTERVARIALTPLRDFCHQVWWALESDGPVIRFFQREQLVWLRRVAALEEICGEVHPLPYHPRRTFTPEGKAEVTKGFAWLDEYRDRREAAVGAHFDAVRARAAHLEAEMRARFQGDDDAIV